MAKAGTLYAEVVDVTFQSLSYIQAWAGSIPVNPQDSVL